MAAGLAAQESSARLSLEEAIRLALLNNHSIKVDVFTRGVGRANLLAAYGAFDPSINFARSYNEYYNPSLPSASNGFLPSAELIQTDSYSVSLGGSMPWGTQYSFGGTAINQRGTYNGFTNNFLTNGTVQITQPLLRGFGFSGSTLNLGLRVARANRGISEWQYRQTVIDTITNVVVAYSDLAAAQANLKTIQRSRDLAAGLVDDNRKRVKVGTMSENDVTSALANVATSEEQILSGQQAVRDADNQLRLLLGQSTFANEGPLLAIDPPDQPSVVLNVSEDLRRCYELRPDFQQARFTLDKSRYNAAYARNQLLPEVDFVGNYGFTGLSPDFTTSRSMVADQDNRSYYAGVSVTIPLTFAQGRGNARAAKLQRKHDEESLELLKEQIALSVTAAAGQVETTRKRVEAARLALDLSQKTVNAELKKLRAGSSNTFTVLQDQNLLMIAESAYNGALADQRRAAATYEHETGITLERHHVELSKE